MTVKETIIELLVSCVGCLIWFAIVGIIQSKHPEKYEDGKHFVFLFIGVGAILFVLSRWFWYLFDNK